MKVVLTFAAETWQLEAARDAAPEAEIAVCAQPADDLAQVAYAEVIFAGRWSKEIFAAARKLRWLHWQAAGVERALLPEVIASDVIVTNSRGVFAIPMADHVFALLLALTRRIEVFTKQQMDREWRSAQGIGELEGKTLGIIGLGTTGEEVAKRAKAFGMRVIATRRRPELGGKHADEVLPTEKLAELLQASDVIAICAPHTSETHALLGEEQLALMRPGAIIVNVARGGLIDEQAMIRALAAGRLGGAGLDVVEEEPLSADSPLWEMPNVIITPHQGGLSSQIAKRGNALFCENLHRYLAGEPLLNVVDKQAGY